MSDDVLYVVEKFCEASGELAKTGELARARIFKATTYLIRIGRHALPNCEAQDELLAIRGELTMATLRAMTDRESDAMAGRLSELCHKASRLSPDDPDGST